jgi:hypothetical protein
MRFLPLLPLSLMFVAATALGQGGKVFSAKVRARGMERSCN